MPVSCRIVIRRLQSARSHEGNLDKLVDVQQPCFNIVDDIIKIFI